MGIPQELEAALIARSGRAVLDEVANLTRLGPHLLDQIPSLRITDVYLDTPDRSLDRHRLALRIRQRNDERLLTLKGEGRAARGGVSRLELELPWSPEAVERVGAEVTQRGVVLPDGWSADQPRLGLEVRQERKTQRRLRLLRHEPGGPELAELAIDEVSYRFGGRLALLHEVEIESKTSAFDLESSVSALLTEVSGLARWAFSKLQTGAAIEAALAAGELDVGPDGTITPEGYGLLERALEVKHA